MAKTYRVAVIGRTGKGNYGHGLDVVWKSLDNVEIVAVADPDEKGRAAAVTRSGPKGIRRVFKENCSIKRGRTLLAWRIASSTCTAAWSWPALSHGASIFLEKPMARTLAEADEMVTACEKHHVKLAIAFQTRHSPRVLRIKELLAEGKLGDLIEMHCRGQGRRAGRRPRFDGPRHASLRFDALVRGRAALVFRPHLAEWQTGDESRRA